MRTKSFGPLTFCIDRPKGTVKEWPQPNGGVKRFVYPVDYGYLPRYTGEDGEGLDFFVGDDPQGHLESFQKLTRNERGQDVLDETKFLVGVTDQERETIYELYRSEVWHRRTYRNIEALVRALPKFKGQKKMRYEETKEARFFTPPVVSRDLPQRLENYARSRLSHSTGSALEAMTEYARRLGHHDVGQAKTLGEYTASLERLGFKPEEIFRPATQHGAATLIGRSALTETGRNYWRTMNAKQAALAAFGLGAKVAGDKYADIEKRIWGEVLLANGQDKTAVYVLRQPYSNVFRREGPLFSTPLPKDDPTVRR